MSVITFKLTAATDVGLARSNNEDNFIVNPDLSQDLWFLPSDKNQTVDLGASGALMVVADGMGGMNAGEVASAIAVDTVKSFFNPEAVSEAVKEDNISSFMKDAVILADKQIKKRVKEDESTAGMGTTIVIAWVLDSMVHVCWCGDSRAYIYREVSGLSRISKDHSYVQQLVDDGKLDEDLAFDHPESNIITRSLGDSRSTAKPDFAEVTLTGGDIILLCSDGLCGLCRDNEIADIIESSKDDVTACQAGLMNAALDNGGYDNVTMALMRIESVEDDGEDFRIDTFKDFKQVKNLKLRRSIRRMSLLIFILFIIFSLAYIYLYWSRGVRGLDQFIHYFLNKV